MSGSAGPRCRARHRSAVNIVRNEWNENGKMINFDFALVLAVKLNSPKRAIKHARKIY